MMIRRQRHCEKCVTDGRTDKQMDGRTDRRVLRGAWSQLKIHIKLWFLNLSLQRFAVWLKRKTYGNNFKLQGDNPNSSEINDSKGQPSPLSPSVEYSRLPGPLRIWQNVPECVHCWQCNLHSNILKMLTSYHFTAYITKYIPLFYGD